MVRRLTNSGLLQGMAGQKPELQVEGSYTGKVGGLVA